MAVPLHHKSHSNHDDSKNPAETKILQRTEKSEDVTSLFSITKSLGHGDSCDVWQVVRKHDHQHFAMKRLRRSFEWSELLFETETTILNHLNHPGIVEIEDVFGDNEFLYIITELGHTDMFARLSKFGRFTEDTSRVVIRRILEAVAYLHELKIVHRDLKPENIIFTGDDFVQPKLIDFADAITILDGRTYTEFVGTPCYLAPERLRAHSAIEMMKSDLWAVGVMAYEMVTGKRCFYGTSTKEVFKKIQRGRWHWPNDSQIFLSASFKNFVESLLTVNSERRCSAEEALAHPWVAPIPDTLAIPALANMDSGKSTSTVAEEDEERIETIRLGLLDE